MYHGNKNHGQKFGIDQLNQSDLKSDSHLPKNFFFTVESP